MAKKSVHFRSEKDDWGTPTAFFDRLERRFQGFDRDVCASDHNAKCKNYWTKEDDALSKTWTGYCWMNPPYGRQIGEWVKKAYESADSGEATVVCLLPSRTDTKWWHEYVMRADTLWFVKGRLKFEGAPNSAPFPSVVAVFGVYPNYMPGRFSYV
ncbi:DNA N-6-adenine-methyltransferase [Marinobacter sp.]|jgi:phage N-6-adenine-methyltransferase|uniref:DNA N-6-adenine-methyltransferase n=1 Tax=Marinobacter sp. TaxID=50741 RepID=UPI000C92EDC1|nr:DNA N-6-adenine-methyltransferase [Marinobacter sp.]MAK51090.1 adenine methyltransferase [Marinobacter sp.]